MNESRLPLGKSLNARRRFARDEILGRLKSIEAGETTRFERCLIEVAIGAHEVVSRDGWRILDSPAYKRMKAALEDLEAM